jgi:hypothetical protein
MDEAVAAIYPDAEKSMIPRTDPFRSHPKPRPRRPLGEHPETPFIMIQETTPITTAVLEIKKNDTSPQSPEDVNAVIKNDESQ